LARHHSRIERGQRRELSDDRPFQTPAVVEFRLGAEVLGDSVEYRVVYERVAYLRGDDEANAVVSSEIVLAQGALQAETAIHSSIGVSWAAPNLDGAGW
jgi:hypothetical protein